MKIHIGAKILVVLAFYTPNQQIWHNIGKDWAKFYTYYLNVDFILPQAAGNSKKFTT